MAWNRRGNPFDDFDSQFEEMDRMMDRMLGRMRRIDWSSVPANQPVYYGVSVDVGPDGQPRVEHFGNVRAGGELLGEGVREPFVTSFLDEEKDQVRITAEMPGIEKDDVKVEGTDETLTIRADGTERKYEKALRLPRAVDPDSAKARYKNGILEVTLDLREPVRPKPKDIQVE